MEKGDECRAWELLHSPRVRQMFKSQNRFVIEAVNDYYDRCVEMKNDPYLETREKEDAFAERIVEVVEKKVMSNLPALFGMYMAQMQVFPLSVPMGAYSVAQGGMVDTPWGDWYLFMFHDRGALGRLPMIMPSIAILALPSERIILLKLFPTIKNGIAAATIFKYCEV